MGDKWMTSGAWRLKEKQSRTFAARQRQSQARTQNDTSVPSIIMTGGSRETKVRNHKRRLRSNGSGKTDIIAKQYVGHGSGQGNDNDNEPSTNLRSQYIQKYLICVFILSYVF